MDEVVVQTKWAEAQQDEEQFSTTHTGSGQTAVVMAVHVLYILHLPGDNLDARTK